MAASAHIPLNLPRLTEAEFDKIRRLVYDHCGINLEPCKKIMLESRLNKRLRAMEISSFSQYIQFITSTEGIEHELTKMIDVVTTNKTDFFREPHHFDFLNEMLLPRFREAFECKAFRVWSAACSTGEEPYTLAMVLEDFAQANKGFTYKILASDISTNVLEKAVPGIYSAERASDIPDDLKKKYLLKSKDRSNPKVRIVSQLREKIQFFHANLTESPLDVEGSLDVIFCRNVLIYFDRIVQLRVVQNLLTKLRPGGMLFIGHSESLHFFDLPVKQIKPTVFMKL